MPLTVGRIRRLLGHEEGEPTAGAEYEQHTRARYGWEGRPPAPALIAMFEDWTRAHLDEVVADLTVLTDWARTVPRTSERGPCWENDYWGSLDALWQVAALRSNDPARYVEVGSGSSTLFARRAIEDFGLRTRITSVDPAPRREVDDACDEIVRQPLELTDLSVFDGLEAGDVVLIDGSHVVAMNSDVVAFFLDVLPRLPTGVLVGVDDIYLPWDYHPSWVGRGYSEQYLVAAYLLGGAAGDRLRFPGWAISLALADDDRLGDLWAIVQNRFGRRASSLWLERA